MPKHGTSSSEHTHSMRHGQRLKVSRLQMLRNSIDSEIVSYSSWIILRELLRASSTSRYCSRQQGFSALIDETPMLRSKTKRPNVRSHRLLYARCARSFRKWYIVFKSDLGYKADLKKAKVNRLILITKSALATAVQEACLHSLSKKYI